MQVNNISSFGSLLPRNIQNSLDIISDEKINQFSDLLNKGTSKSSDFYQIASSKFSNRLSKEMILESVKDDPEKKKLYDASKEFASFFTEKVFKEMKKNIPKSDLFHGGRAEEIFDELLLTERVKKITASTNMGLAEMVYQSLADL